MLSCKPTVANQKVYSKSRLGENMISQLSGIFTSRSKAQEIVLLLHEAKEVVRQGFYKKELPAVEKFCQGHSLFLVKSKFKVILDDENQFTNKGVRIPGQDQRPGMHLVYFSKDETKAYLASYYELINDHHKLGLLLGYPECCVYFFCQNFKENNTNLELKPTNMYTNISKRHEDIVLISHFPCSSECKKSIEMGKKYFKVLEKIDSERSKELQLSLS